MKWILFHLTDGFVGEISGFLGGGFARNGLGSGGVVALEDSPETKRLVSGAGHDCLAIRAHGQLGNTIVMS
jgi:hypothetical protein